MTTVEFVELGGRPGHEGYFPIATPLRMNVPQMLSVSFTGPPVARFRLINSAGETLQQGEPATADENQADRELLGRVTPAHATFRVVVEGRDASGFPFQRIHPRLFNAKP